MAKVLDRDDAGVEVSVETGFGWITSVAEPSGQGRNVSVEIRAEHLNKPVKAWVDTAEVALYAAVRELCAGGVRIAYRVVVKRKRNQPTDCPLADIPTDGRIRDLEHVERVAGVVAPDAAPVAADAPPPPTTRPEASPSPTASSGPQSDPLVCGGPCGGRLNDGRPVRRVHGVMQHVECPAVDPAAALDDRPPPDPRGGNGGATPATSTSGPRIAEAKPWEFYNSDGSINPGSYAYSAAEGMVLLASDLLLARARSVADGPDGFKPPTEGQIKALARRLLRAADSAQTTIRNDRHVARMANSHQRARAATRAALEAYPVPWGATSTELDHWVGELAGHAAALLRVTVGLLDPEPQS